MEKNIDLFGNSTLTPRQVIQQQLAKSMENTEALYKDADPVNRAAAIWGSGLGGLFRQVLQEKGIIDKDPEVLKAEEAQKFRGEVDKRVQEAGVDITKDPEAMGDFAVKVLTERNEDGSPKYKYLEDMLPKALQYSMTMQAVKRAKESDESAAVKNLEGYTPGSQEEFRKTGDRSKLIAIAGSEKGPWAKLNPGDYTVDSRKKFLQTGNYADLQKATSPEQADKELDRKFNKANKLRDEFRASSKNYIEANEAYQRIKASANDPSPVGDLSLIYSYVRMLDPRGAVRDSDYDAAIASGSYGQRLAAAFEKASSGKKLDDDVRKDFSKRADILFQRNTGSQDKLKKEYTRLSQKEKIDPELVIVDFTSEAEKTPPAKPNGVVKIATDEEYNNLPSGTEFIDPKGIKRRKP